MHGCSSGLLVLEGMVLPSKDAGQSLKVVTDMRDKPPELIALYCIHVQ